jgi:predicted dehydrogenase
LTVVRDVPPPPCSPGSLLVHNEFSVISSGTERSRVALSQKSLVGKARDRPDLVRTVVDRARREGIQATRQVVQRQLAQEAPVGYSSAGRVIEIGSEVAGFRPGDRVACAGGGHANHAETVSVPANLCAKVPAGVPTRAAALTTIASIALHGIRLADVRLGDRVAVIGCGLVGQLACRLLHAAGAAVFALDVDPMRVEQARERGHQGFLVGPSAAEQVIVATGGVGVDQALVTAAAPSNEPLLLAGEIARDRAAIVVVGDVPTDLPRPILYGKELTLRVSRSYGPGRYDRDYEERGLDYPIGYVRWTERRNMECVLDLEARGLLQLETLIENIVPVDDAASAYERLSGPPEERPRGAIALSYPEANRDGDVEMPPSEDRSAGHRSPRWKGPTRIGLIGPGGFAARVIVPALVAAGARLELVGGGAGPSAQAAVRELGFDRVASSVEEVIADAAVDAVVICTRHGSHARLAAQALAAGKHVFCEKPLALSVDELRGVLKASQESEGVLAVGFNRRFAPFVRELRDFLEAAPGALTASYRVSAGALPGDHWVHDLEEGGGRALGEACHFVDTLAYLADSQVVEVHASGHGEADAPVQALDNLTVNLTFADGSIGSILYVAQGSARVPKERLEAFAGTRTAIVDDFKRLELFDGRRRRRRTSRSQDKGHREEIRAFLEAARLGEAPVALGDVIGVSLATLGVVESLRTGEPVSVEPVAPGRP